MKKHSIDVCFLKESGKEVRMSFEICTTSVKQIWQAIESMQSPSKDDPEVVFHCDVYEVSMVTGERTLVCTRSGSLDGFVSSKHSHLIVKSVDPSTRQDNVIYLPRDVTKNGSNRNSDGDSSSKRVPARGAGDGTARGVTQGKSSGHTSVDKPTAWYDDKTLVTVANIKTTDAKSYDGEEGEWDVWASK